MAKKWRITVEVPGWNSEPVTVEADEWSEALEIVEHDWEFLDTPWEATRVEVVLVEEESNG